MAYPRLGGCGAWEMDGSVSAGTAAFYGPYKHPEDTNGECYYSDQEIDSMVARANVKGFQISAHAIGPRAIEPLLTALENRPLSQKNPLHHRIEHFEFPSYDQVKRAVDSNIILVPQPGWTWMDSQYQKPYAFHLTDHQFQSQIPLQDIFDETVPLEDLRVEQVFMAGKTMNSPSLTPLKLLVRLIFSRRRKI